MRSEATSENEAKPDCNTPRPTILLTRTSHHFTRSLAPEHVQYAALDAIVSLQIYTKLQKMTSVTKRYTPEEAVPGLKVDVATKGWSEFFGRVAEGEILEENDANLDLHAKNLSNKFVLKSKAVTTAKKNKRRLVTIKEVLAPNYVLSLYKHSLSGEDVTFKEFSKAANLAANFTIFLPVTTLAPTLPRAVAENEDDDHDREEIVIVDNIDDGDNGKGDNDNNNSGAHDGFDGVFADNAGEEEDKEEEGEKKEEEKEEDGDDAVRPAVGEGTSAAAAAAALADLMLGPFPDANDFASFSAVLDDIFHFLDRVKLSMHHPSKKDYFVALRDAVMIEDEDDMKKVVAALKKVGLSDEQIKQRKKFNYKWFSLRVKRYVPEPKILYERVRAVYAMFGDRKDNTKADSKPLFKMISSKKAT